MSKDYQTPKTIFELIQSGYLRWQKKSTVMATYRDFLSQKFQVAFIKAEKNPEAVKILQELFESLTKE